MEYKRNLPHFDHIGASFFVTFRLFNSIPVQKALQLKRERDIALKKAHQAAILELKNEQKRIAGNTYFRKIDHLLDHLTFGDRFLHETNCTNIVKNVLHEYDKQYYDLQAYCIMPNHVHLLLDTSAQLPFDENDFDIEKYQYLKDIMRRIKGKTGLLLNRERGTSGSVWFPESYDRYIRHQKHYTYTVNYITENPVKVGLVSHWAAWNGTYVGK